MLTRPLPPLSRAIRSLSGASALALAEHDPQARSRIARELVEPLETLRRKPRLSSSARTSTVTTSGAPASRSSRLCASSLGEHHDFEDAARVGQLHEGEAAAARRIALAPRHRHAGETEARRARPPRAAPADRRSARRRAARGSCRKHRADGSRDKSRSRRTRAASARPAANRRRQAAAAGAAAPVAEKTVLLARAIVGRGRGVAQQQVDRGEGLRAVAVQRIERAGLDEALELAAVEALRIEPAGEIEEIGEGTAARVRSSTSWRMALAPTPFTAASA